VYWLLLGHELSFQAKALDLGRGRRTDERRRAAAAALQSPGPGRLSLEPLLVIPVRSNQEPLFLGINSNNN
jgi:hypothetical protein